MNLSLKRTDIENFLIMFFSGAGLYFSTLIGNTPNPDTIWSGLFFKKDSLWEVSLGRVLIGTWQNIFSGTANAPFVTIITLLFLSAAAILIIHIFEIRGRMRQILTGLMSMMIVPSTGCLLTYYYCSIYYSGAYFFMVLAFYIMVKSTFNIVLRYLLSIILIAVSLGTYQAYLPVWLTLSVLWLIYMLMNESDVKNIALGCVNMVIAAVLGVIAYLTETEAVRRILGAHLTSERGFDQMGRIDFPSLPGLIIKAYRYFILYFFGTSFVNNTAPIGRLIANAFIFGAIVLSLILWVICGKQKVIRKTGVLVLIALLPLAIMSIVILAPKVTVRGSTGPIMLVCMGYIFILLAIILDSCSSEKELVKKIIKFFDRAAIAFTCLSMFMTVLLMVDCQTYMYINLLKTTSVAREIDAELIRDHGCLKDQKVMIIGQMEKGNYPETQEIFANSVSWTTASYRMIWEDYGSVQNGWNMIFYNYLGSRYQMCYDEDLEKVKESEEYGSMTNFPEEGSVKKIGDVIVVRLSEADW